MDELPLIAIIAVAILFGSKPTTRFQPAGATSNSPIIQPARKAPPRITK